MSVTCDSLKNCHLGSFYYFGGELFSQSCQDEGNLSPYSTSFHIRQGGSLMDSKLWDDKKNDWEKKCYVSSFCMEHSKELKSFQVPIGNNDDYAINSLKSNSCVPCVDWNGLDGKS